VTVDHPPLSRGRADGVLALPTHTPPASFSPPPPSPRVVATAAASRRRSRRHRRRRRRLRRACKGEKRRGEGGREGKGIMITSARPSASPAVHTSRVHTSHLLDLDGPTFCSMPRAPWHSTPLVRLASGLCCARCPLPAPAAVRAAVAAFAALPAAALHWYRLALLRVLLFFLRFFLERCWSVAPSPTVLQLRRRPVVPRHV